MNSAFKGKEKEPPSDPVFTDLKPTITYKHLLTPYTSVKHPLRVVALCDGDAFYAGCERKRLNLDWDIPLVVNQWGMVIAVNYPARTYGISRIDKIPDCVKRCPHLKIVHVATYAEGEDEAKYWKNPNIKTHKVSLDLYRRESDKIITMFKEGLPTGEVEKASIDEAFIDFTNPVREKILERFPYLATVPQDAPNGLDTPLPPPPPDAINWEGKGNVIPVHPPPKPAPKPEESAQNEKSDIKMEEQQDAKAQAESPEELGEVNAVQNAHSELSPPPAHVKDEPRVGDESLSTSTVDQMKSGTNAPAEPKQENLTNEDAKPDVEPPQEQEQPPEEEPPPTWHDVALSIAAELMHKIRTDIYTKLGYTTSAGLARNKFLAKLAAGYKKPFSQTVLRNAAIPKFLRPFPFQKIRYLGGKLGEELAKEYDAKIVEEMHRISLEEMQFKFGECSIWVYEILRGIDRFEVKEKPLIRKSMLASKTLPEPIVRVADGPHWIRMLAAELSIRLKEARETTPGLWPKTIALHVSQGWHFRRSRQAPFPYTKDITIDMITQAGVKLFKELVGNDGTFYGTAKLKVSGMSLSLCHIDWMEEGQKNISSFFAAKGGGKKMKELTPGLGNAGGSDVEMLDGAAREDAQGLGSSSIAKKRRWRSESVVSNACSERSEVIDVDALEEDGNPTEAEPPAKRERRVSLTSDVRKQQTRGRSASYRSASGQPSGGDGVLRAHHQQEQEEELLKPEVAQDSSGAKLLGKGKGKGKEVLDYDSQTSFRCPRCKRVISLDPKTQRNSRERSILPQAQLSRIDENNAGSSTMVTDIDFGNLGLEKTLNDGDEDRDRQNALATLRMEHEDFHFAQDLANEGADEMPSAMAKSPIKSSGGAGDGKNASKSSRRSVSEPASAGSGKATRSLAIGKGAVKKKKHKQAEPEGIAKYFIKK